MTGDLLRPRLRDRVVPIVDACAIVVALHIAHGKVEFHDPRCSTGQHLPADVAPQLGKIASFQQYTDTAQFRDAVRLRAGA